MGEDVSMGTFVAAPQPLYGPLSTNEQRRPELLRSTPARPRFLELDALRGLAASAVVLYHFTSNFDHHFGSREGLWIRFPFGPQCVDLFFVISGFVILLTAERCRTVIDFVVARFARLYPPYWFAVAVSFALIHCTSDLLPHRSDSRLHAVVNLTMLQQPFGMPNLDGSYWSLYVELSFYMLVACLMILGRLKYLPGLLLAISTLYAVLVACGIDRRNEVTATVLNAMPMIVFAKYFCLGVWCQKTRGELSWMFVAVVVVLTFCSVSSGELYQFLTVAALFIASLRGFLPWLANPILIFLGGISYSLYLIHNNLGVAILFECRARGIDPNLAVIAAIVVSAIAAIAMCFAIEKPINSLIRFFWNTRRPTAAVLEVR